MVATDRLLEPGGHRILVAGERFLSPPERAVLYVLLGAARLEERPPWWPPGTPTSVDELNARRRAAAR